MKVARYGVVRMETFEGPCERLLDRCEAGVADPVQLFRAASW
jgi:hypothetical protein